MCDAMTSEFVMENNYYIRLTYKYFHLSPSTCTCKNDVGFFSHPSFESMVVWSLALRHFENAEKLNLIMFLFSVCEIKLKRNRELYDIFRLHCLIRTTFISFNDDLK